MGPQEPPARRYVSLVRALRSARVPPMDYRHKPLPEGSLLHADWGFRSNAD